MEAGGGVSEGVGGGGGGVGGGDDTTIHPMIKTFVELL